MCLTAAFVPHRPNKYFHVTASNGIVSSSPYTPLAIMTASPIASVRVFETVAMQMSSRYVRCAPNVVDDRSRDHHAERSSVPGKCFWPPIVRLEAPIVPSIAGTAMPLAAAPYRASGLVLWHQTDMPTAMRDVRSRGQSGKHILAVSLSGFGPDVWSGRALQVVSPSWR